MIDLHTHTTASDGTCTPRELIEEAVRAGLEAVAITDHDTVDGFFEAVAYAQHAGIELIAGVEIGTQFRHPLIGRGKNVHLLAYFFDGPPPREFCQFLQDLRRAREDRNRRLVEKLRQFGIDISLDEVRRVAGHSLIGRPHFARVMVQKGYVRSVQEAFREYLGEGAKAYVERVECDIRQALAVIRRCGGLSSLAHPIRVGTGRLEDIEELVGHLVAEGLMAIEVYHSDHEPDLIPVFEEMANRFGLAKTGGSDFHGAGKPDVRLGVGKGTLNIPYALLEELRRITVG